MCMCSSLAYVTLASFSTVQRKYVLQKPTKPFLVPPKRFSMQVQLAGTSMRLPMGLHGGRRGDGIDLSDESWQPSKLELQARLGASKERQLELEWRLQQAEQKIAQAQVITLPC